MFHLQRNVNSARQCLAAALMIAAASSCFAAYPQSTESFETATDMDAGQTTANWSVLTATQAYGYLSLAGGVSTTPSFKTGWAAVDIAGADNSSAAVLGDVDRDGDLDWVVANKGVLNMVYLNGDSTGGGTGAYVLGPNAGAIGTETDVSTSLALGDVDGDGDLDVVVGNQNQANKVYLNSNDVPGSFSLKVNSVDSSTPDADDTRAVALGDVDGDADLDLVVANAGQKNKLYLNDGAGNFEPVGTAIGNELDVTTSLALVDLDGNGALDLIVGNTSADASGTINRVYMNDGSGGFSRAGIPIAIEDSDATTALALGDVDDDGDTDLVVANHGQANKLYLNNGAGSFPGSGIDIGDVDSEGNGTELDASSSVALMDVDSDADLDIVVGNENQINKLYLNEGAGQFSTAGIELIDEMNDSKAVCLGDVDGDGDLDLLVANNGQNKFYENGRGGGFVEAGTTFGPFGASADAVTSIVIEDLDNDGDDDIVVGIYNQPNKVYLQDGLGAFPTDGAAIGVVGSDADATYSIAIGKVNGDTSPDIVVGNYGQPNKYYLNDGSGGFSSAGVPVEGVTEKDSTYSIALADVDQDGDIDVVSANNYQANKYYTNDGAGTFTLHSSVGASDSASYHVVLANVNADAFPDLLVANGGQANKVYLNNGAGGGFVAGVNIGNQTVAEEDGSSSLAVADIGSIVDGAPSGVLDGRPDIVVGNYAETNKVYFNDGAGGFTVAGTAIGSDTDNTRGVDLADVDNDGDLDLLVANDGQANKIYLNNGSGAFLDSGMPIGSATEPSRYIKLVDNLFGASANDPVVLVGNYEQESKYYKSLAYRTHAGIAVSKALPEFAGAAVRTAILTRGTNDVAGGANTSVQYFLSNNGGKKWYPVKSGQAFVFPEVGSDLRWKVKLNSLTPVRSPVLDSIDLKQTNLLPEFTATPGIEGVFAVGKTLTVVNAEATDAEDGVIDVSYEWLFVDGETVSPLVGATTGSTYVITSGDIDKKIKVKVTAVDVDNGTTAVFTNTVSKTSYVAPTPDPDAPVDPTTDATTDEAVADVLKKRTGGGSLGGWSLLGLMLLLVWRLLAFRQSRRVAVTAV